MAITFVDGLVNRLTSAIEARLRYKVGSIDPAQRGQWTAAQAGQRCRVAGCRNRSGGPRFGFICDEHRKKLSKKAQQAAREASNAKKAA